MTALEPYEVALDSVQLADGTVARVGSRVRATLECCAQMRAYHASLAARADRYRSGGVVGAIVASREGLWTVLELRPESPSTWPDYVDPTDLEAMP